MFSIYLGGAFGQFTPADVRARQQAVKSLLRPSIHVHEPKHAGDYPPGLADLTEKVLTTRDHLLVRRADVLVLDCLGATTVSRGSILEMGWADEARKPVVLIAEPGNPNLFNMSNTLVRFIVPTRAQAADVVNALLT